MDDTRLRRIADSVSSLSPDEEEELFRIFKKHGCDHTCNTNGVFVNLSDAQTDVLEDIECFLAFSATKKTELDADDAVRARLREEAVAASFAGAATAAAAAATAATAAAAEIQVAQAAPAVSIMRREATRFAALKKKYGKPIEVQPYTTPKLHIENYD